MRKLRILIPVMFLSLLCACTAKNQPMQKALDLRSALLQSGGCTFAAACNVNYGETALSFSMDCTYQTDGKARVTIDSPETLRGICAYTNGDAASLRFEDTVAAIPLLDDGRIAPLTFGYLLGSALSQDYISAVGAADGAAQITFLHGYDEQELTVEVILDADTALPSRAEIYRDGTMLLCTDITDFTFSYDPIIETE